MSSLVASSGAFIPSVSRIGSSSSLSASGIRLGLRSTTPACAILRVLDRCSLRPLHEFPSPGRRGNILKQRNIRSGAVETSTGGHAIYDRSGHERSKGRMAGEGPERCVRHLRRSIYAFRSRRLELGDESVRIIRSKLDGRDRHPAGEAVAGFLVAPLAGHELRRQQSSKCLARAEGRLDHLLPTASRVDVLMGNERVHSPRLEVRASRRREGVRVRVADDRWNVPYSHGRSAGWSSSRDRPDSRYSSCSTRLTRVRRHLQDGKLDVDDWKAQRAELTAEHEGARAQVERLNEQRAALEEQPERIDADHVVLAELTAIYAAIMGEARDVGTVGGSRCRSLLIPIPPSALRAHHGQLALPRRQRLGGARRLRYPLRVRLLVLGAPTRAG